MNDYDIRNDDSADPENHAGCEQAGVTPEATQEAPADEQSQDTAADEAAQKAAAEEGPAVAGSTSIYVRRRRTPALGFWVTLAIAVPAVVALLISPLFDFVDATGVLNFMLTSAVFIGVPLAAIAAAIDAFRHRSSGPRGR